MNHIYRIVWNAALQLWQVVGELVKVPGSRSQGSVQAADVDVETLRLSRLTQACALGLALGGLSLMPGLLQAAEGPGAQLPGQFGAGAIQVDPGVVGPARPVSVDLPVTVTPATAAPTPALPMGLVPPNQSPEGGLVTAGTASIDRVGATTTITQGSQNAAIEWLSFNIGSDAAVNFLQPNAQAIALNRVTGRESSQILGKLTANGQVFILNPNGVLFGKTAQVNVGGLVATTLKLSDADFMAGNYSFKGQGGRVENHGTLTAANGGYIALMADQIVNTGTISTPKGVTELVAGSQVTLQLDRGSLVKLRVDAGVVQGLIENGGIIQAEGGKVHLTAKAYDALTKATINHSGVIEAQTSALNEKGEIILLADMQTGTTNVTGKLDASAPKLQGNGQGTDGGFIETSAAKVQVADSARITTKSETGKTGEWLIDPYNVSIVAPGTPGAGSNFTANADDTKIDVSLLQNALGSNNITITTGGVGSPGSQPGNITVSAPLTWSNNTLTLNAASNIYIGGNISAPSGGLTLSAGNDIRNNGGAVNVGTFTLANGNYWNTYNSTLTAFSAKDFRIEGGSFLRVQGGDGSAANPYQLTDIYGVQGMGSSGMLGKSYQLANDIDASGTVNWNAGAGFKSIGQDWRNNPFTGSLNGLGHSINGLTINRPTETFVGLFSSSSGNLSHLSLIGGTVTGKTRVGAVVGGNGGNISNVHSSAAVVGAGGSSGDGAVGGLVGDHSIGQISNSASTGSVTSQASTVGGLVGINRSTITTSYASGSVAGGDDVGGLLGSNDGSVSNSYAVGAVNGVIFVGGLVGKNSGTVNSSYAMGAVQGARTGGLLGETSGSVTNSYWNKETTGQSASYGSNAANGLTTEQLQSLLPTGFDKTVWGNAGNQTTPYLLGNSGPVITRNDPGTPAAPTYYQIIQNVNELQAMNKNLWGKYALGGPIDATATAGWNSGKGFVPVGTDGNPFKGQLDGLGYEVKYLAVTPRNTNYTGLFGYTDGASVRNIGVVNGLTLGRDIAGVLIGKMNGGEVRNAYTSGYLEAPDTVGGLVGFADSYALISSSFSTARVVGWEASIGGLVGAIWYSTLENTYAAGEVSGRHVVGGLVGGVMLSTIKNSYATGKVSASSQVGGLVGNHNSGNITTSYWDIDTSARVNMCGSGTGDGCDNNKFVRSSTGTINAFNAASYAGFDFSATGAWYIAEGSTRPLLRAFAPKADASGVYHIKNVYQLQGMVANLGGTYVLDNNIDASATAGGSAADVWGGKGFAPVGNINWNAFSGSLDGQGFAVNQLTINRPTQNYVGLIGFGNWNSSIKNISMVNADVTGFGNTGILAGVFQGGISKASSSGKVSGGSGAGADHVGGLVGIVENVVDQASSSATVNAATMYVGGLAGRQSSSSLISNSHATGAVTGSIGVGGLVGQTNGGRISDSYATGAVSGGASVGGLAGMQEAGSAINTSYAEGNVSASSQKAGGLVGTSAGAINNSYATGNVQGAANYAGGLVGLLQPGASITNTYASGAVSTTGPVKGGLIGEYQSSTISNSFWNTTTTGLTNLCGSGTCTGATGLDTAGMQKMSSFTGWGIANTGNAGTIWRIYEGDTAPLLTGFLKQKTVDVSGSVTYNGAVQNATVNLNGADPSLVLGVGRRNAGVYNVYSVQQGYDITQTGTFAINKKALTLAAVTDSKTYDGGVVSNQTVTVTGKQGSDTVTVAQEFASKNALGTGNSTLQVKSGYTINDGNNGNNYTVSTSTAAGTIDKKALTVTGMTADTKDYDGNNTAGLSGGSLSGFVSNETVSINTRSGTFDTKDAGSGKAVTVSGVTLSDGSNGGLASNYSVTNPTGLTGTINKKALTVTGMTVDTKTYDGNTTATLSGGTLAGFIGTETVLINTRSGTFNNKDAGTGKAVTVTAVTLSDGGNGGLANNYSVANPAGLTGTIDKANLVVSGLTANNKVYDATTTAVLGGAAKVTAFGSDEVTLDGTAAGNFGDKRVGNDKTITVTGLSLGGTDAKNYTIVQQMGLKANITKAPLALGGLTASNKEYDGNTTATLSGTATATKLGNDDISVSGTPTGQFDTKDAGNGKQITVSGLTLTGTDKDNYEVSQPAGLKANITPKAITAVTGITADSKAYDGSTNAVLNTGNAGFSGIVSGESLTVTSATGQFADKDAATGKTVNITGIALADKAGAGGGKASNYTLTKSTATTTANITARQISAVTGITAANKIYDGGRNATLNIGNAGFTGIVAGESLTVAGATGQFDTKDAATGKTVAITGIGLADKAGAGGGKASNYTLASSTATTTADITAKALTIAGMTASNKVYDASKTATLNGGTLSGVITGDTVSFSGQSGQFSDKNVGTAKTVTVTGAALSGADAGNYTVAQPTGLTADITAKALTIAGMTAANKIYDATRVATLSGGNLSGVITGDTVSFSGQSGQFSDKNVGTAKTVTVSGATLSGTDAGNYTVAQPTGLTADITAKALTIAGMNAANKVYDATTAATLNGGSLSGVIAGDTVSVSGQSGQFSDKNVGTAKTVTVTGAALSGTDAGNYTVAQPTGLTADITAKALTIAGMTASNKIYDATRVATLSGGNLSGVITGDTVSFSGQSGEFNDKNVGTGKTVTVTGAALSGTDAGNYTVAQPTGLTADITAKALTIAGMRAANKIYDATTAATLNGGTLSGVIAGDAVNIGSLSGQFTDKNVGTGKTVTVSGAALSGADAGNYIINQPSDLTADITPKALTIAGLTANNKVYDATTAATLRGGTLHGVIAGDTVNTGTLSGQFSDKNVGTAKTVTVTGAALSGADAGNYTVTQPTGLTADITKAQIALTGLTANNKVYDATTAATLSGTAMAKALGNDSVTVSGNATGTFTDKNVGKGKQVAVTGLSLSGVDAGNYEVTQPTGLTADITPKALTIAGLTANNKVYDATTVATLNGGALSGVIAGDVVASGTLSGQFSDKNVGTAKTVTVSGAALSGADAGNYTLAQPTGVTADITAKALTITGMTANNKVYDATTAATLNGGTLSGVIAGDTVNISGQSGQFSDKNVGKGKAVTVTGAALTGTDAGNYTVAQPTGLTADITPAALTYVADATSRPQGQPNPVLTGTVKGFVGGDTQGTATTGSLSFSSETLANAAQGSYAINGGGLTALNYTLSQAPGNATALTVTRPLGLPPGMDGALLDFSNNQLASGTKGGSSASAPFTDVSSLNLLNSQPGAQPGTGVAGNVSGGSSGTLADTRGNGGTQSGSGQSGIGTGASSGSGTSSAGGGRSGIAGLAGASNKSGRSDDADADKKKSVDLRKPSTPTLKIVNGGMNLPEGMAPEAPR